MSRFRHTGRNLKPECVRTRVTIRSGPDDTFLFSCSPCHKNGSRNVVAVWPAVCGGDSGSTWASARGQPRSKSTEKRRPDGASPCPVLPGGPSRALPGAINVVCSGRGKARPRVPQDVVERATIACRAASIGAASKRPAPAATFLSMSIALLEAPPGHSTPCRRSGKVPRGVRVA